MNLIKKLLVAGSCAAALASCRKTDITPDDYLTYKMDGVFKTAKPDASYYSDNTMMIDGSKGSDDITLFINTPVSVGTFHIGKMQDNIAAMYVNWDNTIFFDSDTGTLVINSFDGNRISGSFRFAASNGHAGKNFTEGQFNSTFDYVPYDPSDTTTSVDSTTCLARYRILMRNRAKK